MLRSGSNRSVQKSLLTVNPAVIIRTERSGFLYNVTERISARRATHGLLRSKYPPLKMPRCRAEFVECHGADIRLWEKSRIVTERISTATNVTERCGLIKPLRKKTLRGHILTPCTSLIITSSDPRLLLLLPLLLLVFYATATA